MSWLAVALSLTGNVLIVLRRRSGFVVWTIGNCVWIGLALVRQDWAQVALFGVYSGLNVWGLIAWKKAPEWFWASELPDNAIVATLGLAWAYGRMYVLCTHPAFEEFPSRTKVKFGSMYLREDIWAETKKRKQQKKGAKA